MIGIVTSENLCTSWPRTAAAWAAWRMSRKAVLFPEGIPTSEVDSVASDFAGYVPRPAESVVNLHDAHPGGRSGGTELRLQLVTPKASPVGALAVWMSGHMDNGQGWDYQVEQGHGTGSGVAGIVEGLLTAGVHVLAVDMPDNGVQPDPQTVTVNGSVTTISGHAFAALDSDGGPPAYQMFTRHVIRGITTALRITGASRVVLIGHSGGGTTGALVAAMDDRMSGVYILQGGTAYGCDNFLLGDYNSTVLQDYEGYYKGAFYHTSLPRCGFGASVIAAAALPGRRLIWAVGADDTASVREGTYVDQAAFLRIAENYNDIIRPSGGLIVPYIQPAGGGHGPSAAECVYVLADIEAHL